MEEIFVDQEKCVGCGRCTEMCPTTFRLNEETAKSEVISHDDIECAKRSADECPQEAITVEMDIK